MWRRLGSVLIIATISLAQTRKVKPDYVPDKRTAERIAEAVLVARYGQERVTAQLPLQAEPSTKDVWIVQGQGPIRDQIVKGGNFGVWIDRHSGCVTNVVERMK